MITGATKNLGVIGYPIAHSFSPCMQNAAIAAAGADYAYIALPVAPAALAAAVEGLRSCGFAGFNVTIPHKVAILPLLDALDESARAVGAVNTVRITDGRLCGYNTDGTGFVAALQKRGFAVAGSRVALFGAGGAARAVLWSLLRAGARSVTIGARDRAKARALAEAFAPEAEAIAALDWQDAAFAAQVAQVDLLVNATPLGMVPREDAAPPVDWAFVRPQAFVCDLIYNPARTCFLRAAEERGCAVMNGEGMLVEQGAAAFEIWTGQSAPTDVMYRALRQALDEMR